MATYKATFFGDEYCVSDDWSQASSPVEGDEFGRQVADFRHDPRAAMRAQVEHAIEMGGDDPEDCEDEINAALDAMVAVGSEDDLEQQGLTRIGETDCYLDVCKYVDGSYVRAWRIAGQEDEVKAFALFDHLLEEHGVSLQDALAAISDASPEPIARHLVDLTHSVVCEMGEDRIVCRHGETYIAADWCDFSCHETEEEAIEWLSKR